jgi:hypothetical protein
MLDCEGLGVGESLGVSCRLGWVKAEAAIGSINAISFHMSEF